MAYLGIYSCVIFMTIAALDLTSGQVPQRFQIPGAVLVSQPKANPVLRQRIQQYDTSPSPRLRGRPIPANAIPVPVREVRPVVEDIEEDPQPQINHFDDEVARLGLSALQTAVQQVDEEPIAFRPQHGPQYNTYKPERPLPITRQDIRDLPPNRQSKPIPVARQEQPRPVIRQELRQEQAFTRPAPSRQEFREEIPVQHVRRPQPQPQPQPIRQAAPQPIRQAPARIASRPAPQYLDDEDRTKKPPVQILRKYRTDNADGSITWGYENEDGSFKEENIGIDCITRGKYGYVDPDGVKREYSYETGGTCEEPEEELADLPPQQIKGSAGKKPLYRLPAQAQYSN